MKTWARRIASTALVGMVASPAVAQTSTDVDLAPVLIWVVLYVALFVGIILVALIPTIIAFRRRHQYRWLILVVNVVFGATGIGWIVALIWALNSLPFTEDFHGRLGTVRVEAGDRPLQVANVAGDDPVDQLQRLKRLHTSGALTDAEYENARRPLTTGLFDSKTAPLEIGIYSCYAVAA